ncbi:MAG: EF2563 family selenium-dependent molybdenum hydroxylase system protein [Chloroflexi bacterium]|nr:EF2563 family selenium-dependent molybdenum hydroxylase system protein [Chloroflexota bacterium]
MRLDALVLVKGGGDMATGAAYRLFRAGFRVLVTEMPQPTAVRRTVSFAEAVYAGENRVEGVTARRAGTLAEAQSIIECGFIPVLVDPLAACLRELSPSALVDAVMAKVNTGTRRDDAPCVIALGPGFEAGLDCHAVVETNRGHHLGRVITSGGAEPNTGTPGSVGGETERRILRADRAGRLVARRTIGDFVKVGEEVANVDGAPVLSRLDGVLRGLLHDGLVVAAGAKIGDVDPRAAPDHCFTISDKSLAVGGGVLEAVMRFLPLNVEARRATVA